MTRPLTITAADPPVVPGTRVWIVREGLVCLLHQQFPLVEDPDCGCSFHPPVEFVQACAPCECIGRPTYSNVGPDHDGSPDECPNCDMGRCRVELVEVLGDGTRYTLGYAYAVGQPLPIYGPDEPEPKVGLHVLRPLVAWVDGIEQQFTTAEVTFISEDPDQQEEFITAALAHAGPPETLVGKWAIEMEVVGS